MRYTLLTGSTTLALACLTACVNTTPSVQQTAAAAAASAAYDYDLDIFHPVTARKGMVSSEHELASRVGLNILKSGGNAVDAAVGMGFALAVTLPNAGNIGGGGFMVVFDAKTGKSSTLDFREVAPQQAHRNLFLDRQGKVIDGKSLYTHYAVGVPGTVAGMEHALKKWGTLPLARVIAPSIALAEKGFPVSQTLAEILQQEKRTMSPWPATTRIFWKNGAPLQPGDLLVQKDLGQSLRLIARQGAKAFYEGSIARKIAAEMAPHAGAITLQDLREYKVAEREPVRGTYRGYEVITMPPPSSGGTHLIQILNMLEQYPLSQWGQNSAQTLHYIAESSKLAYADRSEYLGDPDFVKVPVKGLTSKLYAQSLAQTIDPNRARPAHEIKPGNPQPYESDQTTHYSVVDKAGNAVSVTYTLNTNFGSGIVAKGTGILLNNEMDDFAAKANAANAYGLVGGDANTVGAKKRPLSSMTPALVLKDGKPVLVTGSPGGARIITTVLQTVLNTIDFDNNPAEAASVPRIHHQWTPDVLRVEKGLSPDTLALLKQRGHHIVVKASMGRTQTIQIRNGRLYGYSDPRNPDGLTLGY